MYINIIIDYMYHNLCINVYMYLLLLCTIFIYKYQTYVLFYIINHKQ
jgi:hypothetical protein